MIRGILGAVLVAALAGSTQAAPPTLKMAVIDMEEGAATLFVTPEGRSLLIDTGASVRNGLDGAKNSADRVAAVARSLGVTKIDYLIVTHYHGGHIGGVEDLAAKIPIGTFIDHGPNTDLPVAGEAPEAQGSRMARRSMQYYAKYLEIIKGHRRIIAKPGDVLRFGSLTATIVASAGKTLTAPLPAAGGPGSRCDTAPMADNGGIENTNSVASILTFGKVRIAALGDIVWNQEHDLACPVDKIGHVNILLVTHHGNGLSTNPAIIAALRPDIAVMANSAVYGAVPPTVNTIGQSPGLQGFWKMHASKANPGLDGDPDYIANLNPAPDHGDSIRLTVSRAGRVTVANSRNGFSRTYQVK
ncbi:MAG TPA: MBL fold metallo-hydrolase [Phenylobacterium sp.]|nr:MBL fold metallo-hydrolase [Phenylobacterium sp.]